MRNCWFLSLGMCVLSAGSIHAQPTYSPISTPGESRTAVPARVQAPTNKLAERSGVRGFADTSEARASLPPAPVFRRIGQPERAERAYQMTDPPVAAQSVFTPTPVREVAIFRPHPGNRVNKLSEAASSRHFAPQDSNRSSLPNLLVVPTDRRGLGER